MVLNGEHKPLLTISNSSTRFSLTGIHVGWIMYTSFPRTFSLTITFTSPSAKRSTCVFVHVTLKPSKYNIYETEQPHARIVTNSFAPTWRLIRESGTVLESQVKYNEIEMESRLLYSREDHGRGNHVEALEQKGGASGATRSTDGLVGSRVHAWFDKSIAKKCQQLKISLSSLQV